MLNEKAARVRKWIDGGCSSWGVPLSDIEAILNALPSDAVAGREPVARARVYMWKDRRQFSVNELGTKAAGELPVGVYDLYATPPAPKVTEATHRHKKRGTEYVLIGIGKMQAEDWEDVTSAFDEGGYVGGTRVDMRQVAIYRSVDDGSLWVRPREEFEDGRFEALTAPQESG